MSKIKFVFAILLACACAAISLAQTSKGTIVGTVLDPNGAAVSGATIKLTNTETGVSRDGRAPIASKPSIRATTKSRLHRPVSRLPQFKM